jgi:sec-independent protein translocase protein TatB
MNFLGMGPLELMLIVVLALIVFGPAKLPEIMGQIGRAIGDFRRATSELSDEFNRTIQAELNETRQTIEETKSALTEVRSAVDSTMSETRAAVTGTPAPQRIAAPAPAAETNGLGHEESSTNGSAPAMADTSQWSWETSPARPESEQGEQTEPQPAVSSDTTTATDEAASSEPTHGEAEPEAEAKPTEGASPQKERLARDELQPPY